MVVGPYLIPMWAVVACALAAALAVRYVGLRYGRGRGERQAGDLEREAASRGWQCGVEERGLRTTWRFRGTTESIAWSVESVHVREPGDVSGYKAWTNWTADSRGLQHEMVQLWPADGGGGPPPGAFALPAVAYLPLIRPLLGESAARNFPVETLMRARPAASGPLEPHFRVLSTTADSTTTKLAQDALLRYVQWQGGAGRHRPGVPLRFVIAWDRGLTVLTRGATIDFQVLDRVVSLGIALAKNLERLK